jgi:hypothetical protein
MRWLLRAALPRKSSSADDTTVPVLAKGKTRTGRLWTYVRDDRLFGGADPPAAVFFYSRNRTAEHPERHLARFPASFRPTLMPASTGSMRRRDRRDGLSKPRAGATGGASSSCSRTSPPMRATRRSASRPRSRLSLWNAVKCIDVIFDLEREINGRPAAERLAVRREPIAPLVAELEAWMRGERARLSRHAEVAKAMDYMLKRWSAFAHVLDDGRICLTNNCAERNLRARKKIVVVRRFGSRRGAGCGDLHADRQRQTQRRQPASLAHRRAGPHQRSQDHRSRRLTLRRTMLVEHAAGEAFRHAERLPCALNAGATAGGA